jgi:hypothetical protein
MAARLIAVPFQITPTHTTAAEAYAKLFRTIHPSRSKTSPLTAEQQMDVYDLAGGYGWDRIIDANDFTTMAMAERVDEMIREQAA